MPFGTNAFRRHEPLTEHTTFHIGGPALFWYEPVSSELTAVADLATRAGLPVLVLGFGSNCLVSDRGFDGLVLKLSDISIPDMDIKDDGSVVASVCGHKSWDEFVSWCCAHNLQGLECMAGIPGTVGGAVFGAIGAYGQNIADILEYVDELDIRTGVRRRRYRHDIRFGYRFSDYHLQQDTVILEAGFRVVQDSAPHRAHPDVANAAPFTATLAEVASGVRRVRERKGAMLWLPHRGNNWTAGSFFKNPLITQRQFDRLCAYIDINDASRWWWPADDGYRVSAARLIERAGFTRGYRIGDAAISPEHTLSLINTGHATATDIISLARRIQDGVHAQWNVVLQPEVRMIGFDRPPLG